MSLAAEQRCRAMGVSRALDKDTYIKDRNAKSVSVLTCKMLLKLSNLL